MRRFNDSYGVLRGEGQQAPGLCSSYAQKAYGSNGSGNSKSIADITLALTRYHQQLAFCSTLRLQLWASIIEKARLTWQWVYGLQGLVSEFEDWFRGLLKVTFRVVDEALGLLLFLLGLGV